MPSQGNPKFTVRLPEEKRLRFVAEAYNAGTNAAALVVEFVDAMLAEPGAEMPQPFAARKEKPMTTTTQLHDFGTYANVNDPRDAVLDFLGDQADSFDVDGLADAWRDAINTELDGTTIVLHGRTFYANYPAPDNARELIEEAIENADLGALAEKFDRDIEEPDRDIEEPDRA